MKASSTLDLLVKLSAGPCPSLSPGGSHCPPRCWSTGPEHPFWSCTNSQRFWLKAISKYPALVYWLFIISDWGWCRWRMLWSLSALISLGRREGVRCQGVEPSTIIIRIDQIRSEVVLYWFYSTIYLGALSAKILLTVSKHLRAAKTGPNMLVWLFSPQIKDPDSRLFFLLYNPLSSLQ